MENLIFAVLGIVTVLALVSLLVPAADQRGVPGTTVLAALGLILGFFVAIVDPQTDLGFFSDILAGLRGLGVSAEAFLYLFLPPLLFTAALGIDVRLLFDEVAAVMLLAVVAVVVCTAAVGAALSAFSDVGLIACLLLGAIVATTDPAAVLGVFRDLGAPRRLSTLVAGESVLNDAAAIALFAVLLGMLGGEEPAVGRAAWILVTGFVGGAALGYGLARLACWLLAGLRNSRVGEITLSICLAYFAFILGDQYAGVSGVVAVVAAGLTFAVYGRLRVSPETWGPLVQTWNQIEFWANSLIFVLAAMFATRAIIDLSWGDAGLVALVVIGALAARAAVLYGLLPVLVLGKATAPVDYRYRAVLLWGGLRGAVTLTLALFIGESPGVPADIQSFVVTLATGFVLFTLFVQAPTLRPLISLLRLNELSPVERAIRNRVIALACATVRDQVARLSDTYGFDPKHADAVEIGDGVALDENPLDELTDKERIQVGLIALADQEKALYLRHFSAGMISRQMIADRIAAADRLADAVKADGQSGYTASTDNAVQSSRYLRIALWLHRVFGWQRPLARALATRFEILTVTRLTVRELARFNRRAIDPLLGGETASALDKLIAARAEALDAALATVRVQYPAYSEALEHRYLARAALRLEEEQYRHHRDEALIGREIFDDLQRRLDRRWALIEEGPTLDLGLRLMEMLKKAPLFAPLDAEKLAQVARCLTPHLALPGEKIIQKDVVGRAMYFIVSGTVAVRLTTGPVKLGAGDFFGEMALVTRERRTADVVAEGYCQLLILDGRDFRRLARAIPDLSATIEKVARERIDANEGPTDSRP